MKPMEILVVAGGPSQEREISLRSGEAVAGALRARGHRVGLFDPGSGVIPGGPPAVDVAYNALHGSFGEDGTIQEIFEAWNVPLTGSNATASRLAFDKRNAKLRLRASGLLTPEFRTFDRHTSLKELRRSARWLGLPVVVKPQQQGSSLGVRIVRKLSELADAAAACQEFGQQGLIERYIAGTEWTVPLFDDQLLPAIEIVPAGDFYDFEAKYVDDRTEYRFDTPIPPAVRERLARVSQRACAALGTSGIVRVDLRLDERLVPWVLEVNTSPGMTDHSLVPKSAARAGIDFGELCERACLAALGPRRQWQPIVYETAWAG